MSRNGTALLSKGWEMTRRNLSAKVSANAESAWSPGSGGATNTKWIRDCPVARPGAAAITPTSDTNATVANKDFTDEDTIFRVKPVTGKWFTEKARDGGYSTLITWGDAPLTPSWLLAPSYISSHGKAP
jgi:hypothetical protein